MPFHNLVLSFICSEYPVDTISSRHNETKETHSIALWQTWKGKSIKSWTNIVHYLSFFEPFTQF